jgi:hypothetical protein
MAQPMPQWEYRVVHINVENKNPPEPPDAQVASQRLGGALSPEFIAREFPSQYGGGKALPKHPAEQLQMFLNLLGKEGWELTTTSQVGALLMFFFKRPLRPAPKLLANPTAKPAEASEQPPEAT